MPHSAHPMDRLLLDAIAFIAVLRAAWVINGFRNMFLGTQAGRRRHWDFSTRLVIPEPFLLLAAVYLVRFRAVPATNHPVAAAVGVSLAAAAFVLCAWSSYVYRSVGTGHYVDANHEVVAVGPYRLVRHPMYLGAILVWFGLGVGFFSAWTVLCATLYVLPAYLFYLKTEEAFLESRLGDPYRAYQRRVPMIVPRFPGFGRRSNKNLATDPPAR